MRPRRDARRWREKHVPRFPTREGRPDARREARGSEGFERATMRVRRATPHARRAASSARAARVRHLVALSTSRLGTGETRRATNESEPHGPSTKLYFVITDPFFRRQFLVCGACGRDSTRVRHQERRDRLRATVQCVCIAVKKEMRASPRSSAPWCTTHWTSPRRRVRSENVHVIAHVARRVFVSLHDARGGAAVGTPPPRV